MRRRDRIMEALKGGLSNSEHFGNPARKKTSEMRERWFCNKPLSPVPEEFQLKELERHTPVPMNKQNENVVSSSSEKTYSKLLPEEGLDQQYACVSTTQVSDKYLDSSESSVCSPSVTDDSHEDPDFRLTDNDSGTSSENSNSLDQDSNSLDIPLGDQMWIEQNETDNFGNVSQETGDDGANVKKEINSSENTVSAEIVKSIHHQSNIELRKTRDFCYYCEQLVTNFARHIERQHLSEIDVERIFSKSPQSKERRALIASLRKKGNYLKGGQKCFKPMKRSTLKTLDSHVPCPYCLGYYIPKQLWRHKRNCIERPSTSGTAVTNVPSKILSMSHLRNYSELMAKVFPRMRNDKIALTAQKDILICAFGARYLQSHRDQRFVNVVSRKMRELARLLLEVKKSDNSINDFFTLLEPRYYDLLVQATKKTADYHEGKELYGRPTYALNMGTSLKQCCDVALNFAIKRKAIYSTIPGAEARSNLQTMQQLITSNWKYDVASEASKNLNIKKWNKITIVPLASDLKLLKTYLSDKAEQSRAGLQQNSTDKKAYKELLETVYCRVMMLNRKRPGELQRLKLSTYQQPNSSENYKEFCDAISPTEKILLKHFKRVVIQGKRDRGVPVLFSPDIQNDITHLLNFRKNFVPASNQYLFCQLQSEGHIYGYKVLKYYAECSGCKNPQALTSTRLRKHLATLSQIFNMTDNDLEQLATFMGHTTGIHRKSYRLPDDVYQTAKISKLLILMEEGSSANYKGKSLDEIDIDLEEDLEEKNDEIETIDTLEEDVDDIQNMPSTPTTDLTNDIGEKEERKRKGRKTKKTKIKRVPWTDEQKQVVMAYFKSHIEDKKPPKQYECEKLISMNGDLLKNKNFVKIKVFIQNIYDKKYRNVELK